VQLKVLLIVGVNAVHDLTGKLIARDVIRPAPVLLGFGIVDGLGPGVGDLLAEVGLVIDLEVWHHLLDGGTQLIWVEGDSGHVVDLALKGCAISLKELNGTGDAIVNVDHGQVGLGS